VNPLKQAFERGDIIEYRLRGSEGDWLLCPIVWDERTYEYREYHPLTLPPPVLSSAQQAAVDLANKLIAQRLATDQAAAAMLRFDKAYKPLPWWRLRHAGTYALFGLGATAWVVFCLWLWKIFIRWAAQG
jgi:hypothetical protein